MVQKVISQTKSSLLTPQIPHDIPSNLKQQCIVFLPEMYSKFYELVRERVCGIPTIDRLAWCMIVQFWLLAQNSCLNRPALCLVFLSFLPPLMSCLVSSCLDHYEHILIIRLYKCICRGKKRCLAEQQLTSVWKLLLLNNKCYNLMHFWSAHYMKYLQTVHFFHESIVFSQQQMFSSCSIQKVESWCQLYWRI